MWGRFTGGSRGAEDASARTDVLWDPETKTLDANPNRVLEARAGLWAGFWRCHDEVARTRTIDSIRVARDKALKDTGDKVQTITSDDIRKAAKSFPSGTSIGLDTWTFKEIAQCEDTDLQELTHIIMDMQMNVAPPRQCLAQLLSLLGKKGVGHRAVSTMPTLIRITTRMDAANDRVWNMTHSHEDDTAKPETSCLYSVEERLVEQEMLFLR